MPRDPARKTLPRPSLAVLGTVAVGLTAVAAGCNSGNGKSTRSPGAEVDSDRALPGGGLLRLTPAGPDFFVWVNLEALRDWSHASKLAGPLTPALRDRVRRFRSRWGIDPYRHIDQLVYASRLSAPGGPKPPPAARTRTGRTLILAKGRGLKDRLYRAAPGILAGRGRLLTRVYRGAAVVQAGRSALAFPNPKFAVSSDSVTVLRCVDLFRGRREESVLDTPALRKLWRRMAGRRSGGKPAAVLVTDLPVSLSHRVKRTLGLKSPLLRLAVRVQVGRWVLITVLAEFPNAAGAKSGVLRASKFVNRLAANPILQKTELNTYTRYLQVHQEGKRTYLQFQIPSDAFVRLVNTAAQVWKAVLAAAQRGLK